MKRFMGYLFYTLVVGVIVYWGFLLGQSLRAQARRTFYPYPLYVFMALYPIVLGMVFAVPGLIGRIRQKGKWRIDWPMLLPVGVPTFLLNINIILTWLFHISLINYAWYLLILTDPRSLDISGIVCGFVILSSLIRKPLDEDNVFN
ncbi:hypothetical protein Desaci_1965 [Desulfosporosinus acidiphilus SJ4]|uniref:Uncharacterized protein n=1 Tax=Desulfosporosinus acidiphilus (strain DSM 22704 / JCM 16185 / SJ4) TaxID=646529 RepID=I4D568_DESAJ|nr:hypothetical protein [Desulfosporosinus acidiphilus]AFM40942.1 hypothetical protein Desaci_1965 [Desulfosporosinus acidiphilus SJ4]